MTKEQAELLYDYQTKFEQNASVENAYKLFRELNKHMMYLSVIRLYWKYDMESQSRNTSGFQMMLS